MMKRKKLFGAGVVIALLAAVGIYLYNNLDAIVTRAAEKIASDALGVQVSIGGIDVDLAAKKVEVSGIKIANPPGYRNAHIITAEALMVGLNTASKELIDLDNIEVEGSVVNLEVNAKGMNLTDLKNLTERKEQKESVGSEQVRVIVKHMTIGASVINPSIAGIDKELPPIPVPAVSLSDIGQGGGAPAGKVIQQVMTRYISAVGSAARKGGILPGSVLDDAKEAIDGAAEELKTLFH